MDYITLKETAGKWSVTPRRVNYYCAARAHSRCCKDGNYLANSKGCGKVARWSNKKGKEEKYE